MPSEVRTELTANSYHSYSRRQHGATSPIAQADLYQILQKAIVAPSGHNWQPWRFRLQPDGVELHIVREPILKFVEQEDHGRYLSAGAAIENMCVCAAKLGYSLVAQYFPVEEDPLFVAYIRFTTLSQGDYQLSDLYEFLDKRCTNRSLYDASQPMDFRKLLALRQLARSHTANTQLFWIDRDESEFPQVAKLCGRSEQVFLEFEQGHSDIIGGIRFQTELEKMHRDGLDVRTLDVGPLEIAMLKACQSWDVQTLLNRLGASHVANSITQKQIKSSLAVGLLINDSSDKQSVVLSGRMMERLWLGATKLGLSIQPLYALLPIIKNPNSWYRFFSRSQIQVVEQLVSDFRTLFPCNETNAQFLFRIGHGATPKVRSLRRPLECFILKDD
jgi:hypothetical protein